MIQIEREWKQVKDRIRALAEPKESEFQCSLSGDADLMVVRLGACAAELKGYGVIFGRLGSLSANVSDEPARLVWRVECVPGDNQCVWHINRSPSALSGQELAQAVLGQLQKYCEDYEQTIAL